MKLSTDHIPSKVALVAAARLKPSSSGGELAHLDIGFGTGALIELLPAGPD